MEKNDVVMENGKPKIILSGHDAQTGHVSAEEAKRLAKLYAKLSLRFVKPSM